MIPQIQRQPPRSFLIKKEGDALDLKCSVNGCPTLQLDWLYRSKPITLSKHTQIISSSDSTSLKINRLTKQDEGQYTCVAINTVGRNKKDFWIVVQRKYATTALRTSELAAKGVRKAIPSGGTQGIPGSKL